MSTVCRLLAFSDIVAPQAEQTQVAHRMVRRLTSPLGFGHCLDVIAFPPRLTHRPSTASHETTDFNPDRVRQNRPESLPRLLESLDVDPARLARVLVTAGNHPPSDVPVPHRTVDAGAFSSAEEAASLRLDPPFADTACPLRLIGVHRARMGHRSTHKRHNGTGNYSVPLSRLLSRLRSIAT